MELSPELIVAVSGLLLGVGNIIAARRKSAAEARDIDAGAAGKLSDSAVKLVNELQEQLQKQSDRIDKLEILARSQEATIAEQGGIIMQLRDRVAHLESENGNLRAENEQLRRGGNKL